MNEYANRQEIGEIRFDKDQIIMATTKQSNRGLINQKVNDGSVLKGASLGQTNDHMFLRNVVKSVFGYTIYRLKSINRQSVIYT